MNTLRGSTFAQVVKNNEQEVNGSLFAECLVCFESTVDIKTV